MRAPTYITPAVDALHLPHQGHPRVPGVAVLVEVLAKLALERAVGLHHVCVLQPHGLLLFLRGALLAAVRWVTPDWATAGQHGTCDLLTVYLARRALGRRHTPISSPSDIQLLDPLCSIVSSPSDMQLLDPLRSTLNSKLPILLDLCFGRPK